MWYCSVFCFRDHISLSQGGVGRQRQDRQTHTHKQDVVWVKDWSSGNLHYVLMP